MPRSDAERWEALNQREAIDDAYWEEFGRLQMGDELYEETMRNICTPKNKEAQQRADDQERVAVWERKQVEKALEVSE